MRQVERFLAWERVRLPMRSLLCRERCGVAGRAFRQVLVKPRHVDRPDKVIERHDPRGSASLSFEAVEATESADIENAPAREIRQLQRLQFFGQEARAFPAGCDDALTEIDAVPPGAGRFDHLLELSLAVHVRRFPSVRRSIHA